MTVSLRVPTKAVCAALVLWPLLFAKKGAASENCDTQNATLLMSINFETGTLNSGQVGVEPNFPKAKDALELVQKPARAGKYAVRVKIDKTSEYISAGAYRAEYGTVSNRASHYNEGDLRTYKFSLFLPEDWEKDDRASIDAVWQFKRFGKGPDMFLAIKGDDLVLRTLNLRQDVIVRNVNRGKWIDICLDVSWSATSGRVSGFSKYGDEKDFRRAFSFDGPNMLDTGRDKAYLKWGLYKPGYAASVTTRPRIVFIDDIGVYAQ